MECGGCTLCCKLLPVPWMKSPSGEWCSQCEPGRGCRIYNTVDDRCKSFECAYSQMKEVGIALRPDRCKVVFERSSEKSFFGVQHSDYEMTKAAKNQIRYFLKDGFSVIIKPVGRKATLYLADGHTSEEIYEEVKKNHLNRMK